MAASRSNFRVPIAVALALCLAVLLAACATVPVTQRRGLHLLSEDQLISLSLQQYAEILHTQRLSQDQEQAALVRRVGLRIADAAEDFLAEEGVYQEFAWEFNLFDDDETVNAWCLPGGKVGVYSGILPLTQDEAGLAVVMGHEVAHAIAGHGNERMSQQLLVILGGVALSVAIAEEPVMTRQVFMSVYGVGAMIGFVLPYSRLHEDEADHIGLILMARAGYDPHAAVGLWQRMAAEGGPRPPELLSTHPAPEDRIENIQRLIPQAMEYYRPQG